MPGEHLTTTLRWKTANLLVTSFGPCWSKSSDTLRWKFMTDPKKIWTGNLECDDTVRMKMKEINGYCSCLLHQDIVCAFVLIQVCGIGEYDLIVYSMEKNKPGATCFANCVNLSTEIRVIVVYKMKFGGQYYKCPTARWINTKCWHFGKCD